MSNRDRLLSQNTEPLKLVPAAQRDVWFRKSGWRCYHEDRRGRCTSYATRSYGDYPRNEWLCERHAPK